MISIRVKTLSGGDHPFTVDESISIEEFKRIIAPVVEIDPDHQRFIYMGRVLDNSHILSNLDLDGKVIHLVFHVPREEIPDTTPGQSAPDRTRFRRRLSRMRVINSHQNPSTANVILNNTHVAIEQSLGEMGQSGFVRTRAGPSRTVDIEINVTPNNSVFELNYRIFLIKKFLECAERVLQSLELNNDDNFTDLDYLNEEQRLLTSVNNEQAQLSARFQNSPSMTFLSSLTSGLSSTIRNIQNSFINETYSSVSDLILRFNTVNNNFFTNLTNRISRPDSETLSRYEGRRNRFTHYISHIYHGLSEITTISESDSEFRLVPSSNIYEHDGGRSTSAARIRDNVSRISRRNNGSTSFIFVPPDIRSPLASLDTQNLTQNETITSQNEETSSNVPRSREMRTTHFNVDTLFSALIGPVGMMPSTRSISFASDRANNQSSSSIRVRRNPLVQTTLLGEIPIDRPPSQNVPPTDQSARNEPIIEQNPESNSGSSPNRIHVRIDPFLSCHSYCCETENTSEPDETSVIPATNESTMVGVSTAPSTSSMIVQQDSESEFPRSTNFSDFMIQEGNIVYSDGEQSDTHSQSVITVPDDTVFLQQFFQNNERFAENLQGSEISNNSDNVEPVPDVSEQWMRDIPPDWIGVISDDETLQARTRCPQGPFSDAYINGMSAKRRKMIETEKTENNVSSADDLASIINSASRNAMIEPSISLSNLSSLIQSDESLMNSFEAHIKDKIRRRLDNDPDIDSDRFPFTRSLF